tara:strand:- start:331 stop:999 length:669 start_codon:yes stop_codon:yes gene_type:complete
MKSYSQFSESLSDLYLKEWERLDEDTQKEIIRQYAEENNIELDEELLSEIAPAIPFAAAAAFPWVKAAAVTGGAWALSQTPKWIKQHNQHKENERWLSQSSNIPKSNRTDKQRDQTANTNKNRINQELKNEKESTKINKQLQKKNTTNPNPPPKSPLEKIKTVIKNNPLKSLAVGSGLGYGGLGTLNWYGNKYHNKNNNNGNGNGNGNKTNNSKENPAENWK